MLFEKFVNTLMEISGTEIARKARFKKERTHEHGSAFGRIGSVGAGTPDGVRGCIMRSPR